MHAVLIADGDRDTRILVRQALRRERFEVVEAADPESARELALSVPIDMVILNYPMRLQSGVSLTRALRKDARLNSLIADADRAS